jgi:hypothetical protein
VAAEPLEAYVWGQLEKALAAPDEFLRLHQENDDLGGRKETLVTSLRFNEDQVSKLTQAVRPPDEITAGG